jgi:hypothetical protein
VREDSNIPSIELYPHSNSIYLEVNCKNDLLSANPHHATPEQDQEELEPEPEQRQVVRALEPLQGDYRW